MTHPHANLKSNYPLSGFYLCLLLLLAISSFFTSAESRQRCWQKCLQCCRFRCCVPSFGRILFPWIGRRSLCSIFLLQLLLWTRRQLPLSNTCQYYSLLSWFLLFYFVYFLFSRFDNAKLGTTSSLFNLLLPFHSFFDATVAPFCDKSREHPPYLSQTRQFWEK